jgi:hypothetical protein
MQDAPISRKTLQFSKKHEQAMFPISVTSGLTSALAVGHRRGGVENVDAKGVSHHRIEALRREIELADSF